MGTTTGIPADGIARLLFGSVRRDILARLFGRPDEQFYVRELVRSTASGTGAVQRELRALADAGLVNRATVGRQVFYSANRESPIFAELQSIVAKTAGVADVLRAALRDASDRGVIESAFIYGSVATGRQQSQSDVDLMVVGALRLTDLLPALREAGGRLGREINPSVYAREEFQRRARERGSFVKRVLSGPKIFVIGGSDELGKLAR